MKPRKKELIKLLDHIADRYAGDYIAVSHDLNKAIYYLHFLEKDQIPADDVQDLCFALQQLVECFYHAHSKQRIRRKQSVRQMLKELAAILKEE